MLETWVQNTVNCVLFSWVWSWMHAVIVVYESMNSFINSFVTDIALFRKREMLETWVQNTIDGVLLSWIWSWMHAFIGINESMDSLIDSLISNVSFF